MSETARERNSRLLLEYLTTLKCTDCGSPDWRVITFDHLPKFKKKGTISQLIYAGHSWNMIQKEIAKTQPVCYNCHNLRTMIRERTARQILWEELNG